MSAPRHDPLLLSGSRYRHRVEIAILISVAAHAAAIPLVPPYVPRPYRLEATPLRLVSGGAAETPAVDRSVSAPAMPSGAEAARSRYRSPVVVTEQLNIPTPVAPISASGTSRGHAGAQGTGAEAAAPPVFYAFDSPPKVLDRVVPEYPASAKSQVAEGSVILNANVDERGRVIRVWVARSTASEALVEAAVDALYRFRFTPGSQQGIPVTCTVAVPFNFHLNIHQ